MTHERCFKKHDKAEFFPLFIFMEIAEKTNNEKNKFEESENLQISQKKLNKRLHLANVIKSRVRLRNEKFECVSFIIFYREEPYILKLTKIQSILSFCICMYIIRPVVPGCAGCAKTHPDFGRSVNPISTRGDRLCPPN